MMEDPIPVKRDHPQMSAEEYMALEKQRHGQRSATILLCIIGAVILSLFVPLGVFLTRLAMGAL